MIRLGQIRSDQIESEARSVGKSEARPPLLCGRFAARVSWFCEDHPNKTGTENLKTKTAYPVHAFLECRCASSRSCGGSLLRKPDCSPRLTLRTTTRFVGLPAPQVAGGDRHLPAHTGKREQGPPGRDHLPNGLDGVTYRECLERILGTCAEEGCAVVPRGNCRLLVSSVPSVSMPTSVIGRDRGD